MREMLGKFAREAVTTMLWLAKLTSNPNLAAKLVDKAAEIKDRADRSPAIVGSLRAPDVDP